MLPAEPLYLFVLSHFLQLNRFVSLPKMRKAVLTVFAKPLCPQITQRTAENYSTVSWHCTNTNKHLPKQERAQYGASFLFVQINVIRKTARRVNAHTHGPFQFLPSYSLAVTVFISGWFSG